MLVRHARAARDELPARAVAVAVGDGAVRVVVVQRRRDRGLVPVVREEIVAWSPDGFVEAWVNSPRR